MEQVNMFYNFIRLKNLQTLQKSPVYWNFVVNVENFEGF